METAVVCVYLWTKPLWWNCPCASFRVLSKKLVSWGWNAVMHTRCWPIHAVSWSGLHEGQITKPEGVADSRYLSSWVCCHSYFCPTCHKCKPGQSASCSLKQEADHILLLIMLLPRGLKTQKSSGFSGLLVFKVVHKKHDKGFGFFFLSAWAAVLRRRQAVFLVVPPLCIPQNINTAQVPIITCAGLQPEPASLVVSRNSRNCSWSNTCSLRRKFQWATAKENQSWRSTSETKETH